MKLMEFNDLKKLAYAAAHKTPLTYSTNQGEETFSAEDVNSALRAQFELLAPDYKGFRRNKNQIFELIEETIDDILPNRVMEQYGQFADIRVLAQGDKAVFRQRITEASKKRAKTFVTRVGLAGRYETFMLDGRETEVQMSAIGSACRIGFEEFLDGRIQFSDLTEIILEGMDDYIYEEIAKALDSVLPDTTTNPNNVFTSNVFNEAKFNTLLNISDSYNGGKSTIICTEEFARTMVPADSRMSNDMKSTLWNKGYFGTYLGHNILILRQSMLDETNKEKVIDPSKCYIIPSGTEKPVKLAFEGPTMVRTINDNDDWSTDMQTYKKFGIAVFSNPAITKYVNTSLHKVL